MFQYANTTIQQYKNIDTIQINQHILHKYCHSEVKQITCLTIDFNKYILYYYSTMLDKLF